MNLADLIGVEIRGKTRKHPEQYAASLAPKCGTPRWDAKLDPRQRLFAEKVVSSNVRRLRVHAMANYPDIS